MFCILGHAKWNGNCSSVPVAPISSLFRFLKATQPACFGLCQNFFLPSWISFVQSIVYFGLRKKIQGAAACVVVVLVGGDPHPPEMKPICQLRSVELIPGTEPEYLPMTGKEAFPKTLLDMNEITGGCHLMRDAICSVALDWKRSHANILRCFSAEGGHCQGIETCSCFGYTVSCLVREPSLKPATKGLYDASLSAHGRRTLLPSCVAGSTRR